MIDWMKYAEIQVLKQKGFKKARVAKMLHINRETVAKYWDKPGRTVKLQPSDVLHIPGLGFDGLVGYSPIAMAKDDGKEVIR